MRNVKTIAMLVSVVTVILGCEESKNPPELCYVPTLSEELCDPASVEFTLDSTNPYYPLIPGATVILEGYDDEEGYMERVERTVLEETRTIGGVEVHVLEHRNYRDGAIHEIAYNFYVESVDGTVCYFGEDVEYYVDGKLDSNEGTWRVGVDGAKPGIIMPANPAVGDRYLQENAPDNEALDMGRVTARDETMTVGGTEYNNVLVIMDVNPHDGCNEEERKLYLPGIGEVADVGLELVEFDPALCYEPTLEEALCDPLQVEFTLDSTNQYYPLTPGLKVILEGMDEGIMERVEREVTEETRTIGGVEVHVLEHRNYQNDEIYEIAYNFYVETVDGTVCYFGEDVEFYKDGSLDNTHGTWRVGVNGAKPGVIMPANPQIGDSYLQERAPANGALDMGRVAGLNETHTFNQTEYTDVISIMDVNPQEDCDEEEPKLYAPGIGEIQDVELTVVEVTYPEQ